MASLKKEIQRRVRQWIMEAVPGSRVIPADEKGPRPELPYLTVKLDSVEQLGDDETRYQNVNAWIVSFPGALQAAATYTILVNDLPISVNGTPSFKAKFDMINAMSYAINKHELLTSRVLNATLYVVAESTDIVLSSTDAKVVATPTDPELKMMVGGMRSCTVTVQGFGDGADDIIHQVILSKKRSNILNLLDSLGLSPETNGALLDISELIDTEIEPRFVQELTVLTRLETRYFEEIALEVVGFSESLSGSTDDLDPFELNGDIDA